jgi:hypothetical protein
VFGIAAKHTTDSGSASSSRLLFINLPETIQNQIRITRGFNRNRKRLCRLLKIKRAAGDLDDLPKPERAKSTF